MFEFKNEMKFKIYCIIRYFFGSKIEKFLVFTGFKGQNYLLSNRGR